MKCYLFIFILSATILLNTVCFAYQSLSTYSDAFNMPHGTAIVRMDDKGKPLISVIVENSSVDNLNFCTVDAYIYDDQGILHELDFSKGGLPDQGILRPRSITKIQAYLPQGVRLIRELFLDFDNGYSLHYVGPEEQAKREQNASQIKYLFDR